MKDSNTVQMIDCLISSHDTGESMLHKLIEEGRFAISNLAIIRRYVEEDSMLPILDKCIENYTFALEYFQDLDKELTQKEDKK